MKILLAISEAPPIRSGFARIAARLSDGLRRAGHEVSILSTRETGRLGWGELRLTGLLPRWRSLRRLAEAADVVAVFGPTPSFSDALLWRLAGRSGGPRVVYTHVFDLDLPRLGPLCALYARGHLALARRADRVVAATPDYAEALARGVPSERIRVIPWGIDPPPPDPVAARSEVFSVLYVGQLRRYKGAETLLRAARRLPEVRFVLAGEGPERARLEGLAAELGLANLEFRFGADDAEVARLYAAAHVVALPSVCRLEAFGLVLVEGMARGCVPVASSLPGVRHVVGEVGLLHPPGDDAALAHSLGRLAADPAGWRGRSERARERSREFSWEACVAAYRELVEGLVPPRSALSERR